MKIAIITGASSGIGREFAQCIDKSLWSLDEIWLMGRNEQKLQQTADMLATPAKIIAGSFDDEAYYSHIQTMLAKINPHILMLVNSAGFGLIGSFCYQPLNEQVQMIDINCKALTRMTGLCIPYMKKNSRIIQMASSAGFVSQPGFAVYAASKAYVISFSQGIAKELSEKSIYITTVCPGPVDTPFFDVAQKYEKTLSYKTWFMVSAKSVADQAMQDSYHRKSMSIYGLPMKMFYGLSKIVPRKVIHDFAGKMG